MPSISTVQLRLDPRSEPIRIALATDFPSEAMRWSYVARNRDRWTSSSDPAQGPSGPLQRYLNREQLQQIAGAGLVEVGIPSFADESAGWPLRVFPWEYALSAATRGLRSAPLTVIRHLQAGGRRNDGGVSLQRAATLESAPGRLAQWYDPAAEASLMLTSMGLDLARCARRRLSNPTRTLAGQWLAKEQPSVLHIAGIDSHQAVSLLGLESSHPQRSLHDGLALKHPSDAAAVDLVEAEPLAELLCAGEARPDLIVCNAFNSASRIAARCVAKGAKFAVGYHDVIEDGLAAIFCSTLYRQLAETQGDMLAAFQAAMTALRKQPGQLRGACIVLWSGYSLIEARGQKTKAARKPVATGRPTVAETPAWARIRVERHPKSQFNYSLLHNKQSLFRSLQVFRNNIDGPIRNIRVLVDLHAGDGSFPFSMSFDLAEGENGRDLTNEVVLPLTSALIRTQSERIQSSLRLLVSCDGETVKEETFRVGLSPVDEWQDGEKDEWRWLPSFVLPRDAAVARIIDSAQGILCALADDPGAGFDGYQSVDPNGATEADRYACVDKQVQAIWYAVLNTHGLNYINPPPSYGNYTQRLRTPSQLLAERRGTCIDLALLLCACLEYVDIYPVLFLLNGHAFAGYWRSDDLHLEFLQMQGLDFVFGSEEAVAGAPGSGGSTASNNPGYVLGQSQHLEVQQRVHQRQLIPLEATWLTSRGGFESAATEGKNNLRRPAEFQAMIDIRLARDRGVTPIPLLGARP
jgi:hypothetical protein